MLYYLCSDPAQSVLSLNYYLRGLAEPLFRITVVRGAAGSRLRARVAAIPVLHRTAGGFGPVATVIADVDVPHHIFCTRAVGRLVAVPRWLRLRPTVCAAGRVRGLHDRSIVHDRTRGVEDTRDIVVAFPRS